MKKEFTRAQTAGGAGFRVTIRALAIDPNNSDTIYAGSDWEGVFKSTNGGGSWSQINSGLTSPYVYALAIDPTTSSTIYAGTYYGGVFKSTNGGQNWGEINAGMSSVKVNSLAIDPYSPAIIYVGTGGGGVLKTLTYTISGRVILNGSGIPGV